MESLVTNRGGKRHRRLDPRDPLYS
jgi:hypothetical protein